VADHGAPHAGQCGILGGERGSATDELQPRAGCGCKLGPDHLASLLGNLRLPTPTADVLVAADTGDDAAVVRLPDGRALIATLDYFTPIVDDPYDWGASRRRTRSPTCTRWGPAVLALNVVNWPVDDLPLEMLGRVLQGGIDVAAAAGAPSSAVIRSPTGAEVWDGRARARRGRADRA